MLGIYVIQTIKSLHSPGADLHSGGCMWLGREREAKLMDRQLVKGTVHMLKCSDWIPRAAGCPEH